MNTSSNSQIAANVKRMMAMVRHNSWEWATLSEVRSRLKSLDVGVSVDSAINQLSAKTENEAEPKKYPHYFKHCPYTHVDVYRVFGLFEVTDAAIAHATKSSCAQGVAAQRMSIRTCKKQSMR
jgi:hypothetical protein